jgi:polysaccharide biosynthesis/export protein
MIKNIFVSISVLVCMVVLTGCPKPINMTNYLKYQSKIDSLTLNALDPVIQKNDILGINFSVAGSENAQRLIQQYNSNLMTQGYLVSPTGNITIPSLGDVPVAGKTKQEIKDILYQKLKKYIEVAPVVTIRILNYTVYVEGEVLRPGPIMVTNELITLQQALATAGGTTPFATLSEVLLIRSNYGTQKIAHIDLRNEDIYTKNSEYYYLKQGDQIIINPNKEKIASSNSSSSRTISYASTAIGILLAMFTLFKN